MKKLFICYAGENEDFASEIQQSLIDDRLEVFLGKYSIDSGDNFNKEILDYIDGSDFFLFLASSYSLSPGKYTLSELAFAQQKWKSPSGRIIPVLIDGVHPSSLPVYLRTISAVIPQGNKVAEVRAAVLRVVRKKRRDAWLKTAGFVFGVLLVVFVLLSVPVKSYSDHTSLPPVNEASGSLVATDESQLTAQGGSLVQDRIPIPTNGFFSFFVPRYEGIKTDPRLRNSGGVIINRDFDSNLLMVAQIKPEKNVNTIDLIGCDAAVVFKVNSKSVFFWASETDASPKNLPIDVDYSQANTFGLRQVGGSIAALLNNKVVATYTFLSRPNGKCRPRIFFKSNPDTEASASMQGIMVHEYSSRNIFGFPVLLRVF